MPEEPTQQTEEQPSSSPQPAQPVETPSVPPEAGPVAAVEPGPTADAADLKAQLEQERATAKERLERQQSVLDRNRLETQSRLDEALGRIQALTQTVDQVKMEGMSEDEQSAYRATRERQELDTERERMAQDREALTDTENYWKWYDTYVSRGVPPELIRDAPNFQEMHDRAFKYAMERGQQPAATEQPATPTGTPPVGPADQIQPGGGVAPPLRKVDQLKAEGNWRPDSPEFIEYMQEQRRRERAGVADGKLH